MTTKTITTLGLFSLGLAAGCHKDPARTTLPEPTHTSTAKAEAPKPVDQGTENLGVSDDIATQCKLKLGSPQQAPKFGFDQFELLPQDRDVLDAIAQCITNGPLKGKRLALVGRADPRGTEEYNMGLGSRRAHTVGEYLGRLGVAQTQLKETTRGSLDATGNDDSSWMQDRRVDVQLD